MRGLTRVLQDFKAEHTFGGIWNVPGFGEAWQVGESLIFTRDSSPYLSVGSVDLAALMFRKLEGLQGRDLYTRVLRHLLDVDGVTWETQDPQALARQVDRCILERYLFDLCIHQHLERNLDDYTSFLHSQGVDTRLDPLTIVPFSLQRSRMLQGCLRKLGIEFPKGVPVDRPLLVSPLYKNPHTVGALQFLFTDKTITLPVSPAPLLYTGLPALRRQPVLSIQACPWDAAGSNSRGRAQEYPGSFVQAMVYPAGPDVRPWTFPGISRVLTRDQDIEWAAGVGGVLDTRVSTRVTSVSHALTPELGLNVREYVLYHMMQRTSQDTFGTPARMLMDAYGSPVGFKGVLDIRLREAGRTRALRELSELYADGLLVKQGDQEVHVSSSGYVLFDRVREERTVLTNFIMDLRRQVVFPEHPGTYLEVEIGERRLTLPEASLDSGKKLGQYLQGACNEQGAPRVIEPNKLGLVLRKLREGVGGLPLVNGVSFLGWNGLKNRWYAPGYQITGEGCVEDQSIPWLPHPETQHFQTGLVTPTLNPELPLPLCSLVGQILALAHRWFSGYPVRAVGILNTSHNREIASRVFRGLGQHRILQLNTNSRSKSAVESLRGYPCLVQGGKADKLEEGLFCLGEQGMGFQGITAEQADAAAGTLAWMTRELAGRLVSGEDLLGRPSCRVVFEEALAADGAKIARELGGLIEWPQEDTEFPRVERLLQGVPPVDVHKYWSFDLFEQKVYLNTRDLPKGLVEDVEGLVRELGVFVKDIRVCDGYLSLDAGEAQRMLRNYHGEPVELQSVNLDAAVKGLGIAFA